MALLVSQTRGEFIPLDREAVQPCVLSFYSIIPNRLNKPLPHQNPSLELTLYKFIGMGPLGLDPIHPWAESENRDPTEL